MKPLLALVLAVLSVTPLAAGDWPTWRGPMSTGVSADTTVPVTWSDTENVAWKAPLSGLGVSSPIVSGGRVFVTSQAGRAARRSGNHPTLAQGGDPAAAGERALADASTRTEGRIRFIVEAFDARTGSRAWKYEIPADGDMPPVHDKHNLASASPVTDGERVYAVFGTGQVVALDVTGKLAWSRHLGTEIAPFDITWGHGSSPAIHRELLILPCMHGASSYLLALDRRTGKQVWKTDRAAGVLSYSTPVVVRGPRGHELIVNTSEGVEAYDPATGAPLWHTKEQNRFPIPVPVPSAGAIYLSRGYRSGPYAALRLGGRGDVSKSHVSWHVPTGAPYVSSLVEHDGLLYMAGDVGVITAVDAKTGERVWQERMGGVYTASPVAAGGRIYMLSESGETLVIKAGRTPQVLARNRISGRQLASPAISGGRLFIRLDGDLVAIGR